MKARDKLLNCIDKLDYCMEYTKQLDDETYNYTKNPIYLYDSNTQKQYKFFKSTDLAEFLGVTPGVVANELKGHTKSLAKKGYHIKKSKQCM